MRIVLLSLSEDGRLIPGLHCSFLVYSALVLGSEPVCVCTRCRQCVRDVQGFAAYLKVGAALEGEG